MKQRWIEQTEFYDPATGSRGNCAQACIASILDLPIEDVPNFVRDGDEMFVWIHDWLEERGIQIDMHECDYVYDGFYLAGGPAARGCDHMVVMKGGGVFHDPHPSKAGLIAVKWTYVLIPHDPSGGRNTKFFLGEHTNVNNV